MAQVAGSRPQPQDRPAKRAVAPSAHQPGNWPVSPTGRAKPPLSIGPTTKSYRFTWWVERLARGGQVLAPGDPADPIQVIDARDLATWTVSLLEQHTAGTFHAASPPPPFGFGQLLTTITAAVAPPGTTLTWVDSDFLTAHGADDQSLPPTPKATSTPPTQPAPTRPGSPRAGGLPSARSWPGFMAERLA